MKSKVTIRATPPGRGGKRKAKAGAARVRVVGKKTAGGKPIRLRRILVPTDFSSASRRAIDFAVPLAERFDATIILLHVIEIAIYPQEVGPVVVNDLQLAKTAKQQLERVASANIPPALREDLVVRKGLAYHEIVEAARERKVDMIVLTTHGYTGLKRVLLGGTAERVLRHAPCPVLTVRK